MNLNVFKKPDPTGKMSREKYILKNFIEEYNHIINFSVKNNLINLPFKEKVYLCINNINLVPICKNPNCVDNTNYKNSTIGYYDYCSKKCISNDPYIKKTKEDKSFEKFGTKAPAQSKIIRDKIIKTNNKKYGGNSPMSDIIIQEKSRNTLYRNYGVTNPLHDESILNKRIESFKKSKFKTTFIKTCIDKYGVDNPWKINKIHNKTIDFFYISYKNRIIKKLDNLNDKFLGFEFKPTQLLFNCGICNNTYHLNSTQFYYRINNTPNQLCTNCYPISENSSLMQIDLYTFVRENYTGEILQNRKVLNSYEIDIFLPELKLGIEFNGIYWHSNTFKQNDYHYKKWQKSIESDIYLIAIWEDDWINKKDICKSFILNKLNKTKNKIFARKCVIKEISYEESKVFLNTNHIQGNCNSSIMVGLFYNNDLISLMNFNILSFGKYTLTKFVNKLNILCIGGASKLFSYFLNKYNPISVISFSDNHISNGDLYKKLGFKFLCNIEPDYWCIINDLRCKIIDETTKYLKIFGCGEKKWIYENKLFLF